jgi:carbonic anhydrase/acetyltransferase-like protein (isoleucine patch superfamily)
MTSTAFHFEPIHTDQYVVAGDVVIAAGVAIAPGVLLQADVGSRIILGLGSCLGMGCVLHASGGEIRIDAGVNLGAGVLIVGTSTIGPGAIVGAGTTIMGEAIGAGQLVAPNSLLAKPIAVAPLPIVEPPAPEPLPEPTPPVAAPPESPKVSTEGTAFFYSKGNGQRNSSSNANDDPWAIAEPTIPTTPTPPIFTETITPNTFVDPQSSYFSGNGFSDASNFQTVTGVPTESTFVYPDGNYHPKHPWEDNAKADLGNGPIAPPQPNPDSDLSTAEMQNGSGDTPSAVASPGALLPQTPKQVYGQAYVNQMLGRMNGKKY